MAKLSVKQLVEQANEQVRVVPTIDALQLQDDDKIVLVDIRDIRELTKQGTLDGAVHAPRGMLEFWFDADSPYHREVFADSDKDYVLYCASGWRSALAAKSLVDMGFDNIAHVDGGFAALKDAGAKIIAKEAK